MNLVVLEGHISSDPTLRMLADGSTAVSFSFTTAGGGSVPVSWVDPPAGSAHSLGTELVVVGRIVRRFFRSGGATQSRTEVIVDDAAEPKRRAAVRTLRARAVASLGEPAPAALPSRRRR
jgi:single-strand DNA-binding protein